MSLFSALVILHGTVASDVYDLNNNPYPTQAQSRDHSLEPPLRGGSNEWSRDRVDEETGNIMIIVFLKCLLVYDFGIRVPPFLQTTG